MPYPEIRSWFLADDGSMLVFANELALRDGNLLFCFGNGDEHLYVCEIQPGYDWQHNRGRGGRGSFIFRIAERNFTAEVVHQGNIMRLRNQTAGTRRRGTRTYSRQESQYPRDLSYVVLQWGERATTEG